MVSKTMSGGIAGVISLQAKVLQDLRFARDLGCLGLWRVSGCWTCMCLGRSFQWVWGLALRVQVLNNHILAQNLCYDFYYPNPKYLIIGYMDPKP